MAFAVLDVTRLPADLPSDLITTFDSLHDQRDPATVLGRIAAAPAEQHLCQPEVIAPGRAARARFRTAA